MKYLEYALFIGAACQGGMLVLDTPNDGDLRMQEISKSVFE